MNFTWRQIDTYTNIFNDSSLDLLDFSVYTQLDNNNIFDKFCILDISDNIIEIPLFMRAIVENTIINRPSFNKVVAPLYYSTDSSRRTADSIIIDFFTYCTISTRLQKVVTNKGEVYYGMKGLIFDEQFNPLLFITITLNKETKEYTDINIYVHPSVFINTSGLIHKTIIKKLIPFYVSYEGDFMNRRQYGTLNPQVRPKVIITDVSSRFIQVPTKPSPQHCNDEILNQLLIDNIDDVLEQIP